MCRGVRWGINRRKVAVAVGDSRVAVPPLRSRGCCGYWTCVADGSPGRQRSGMRSPPRRPYEAGFPEAQDPRNDPLLLAQTLHLHRGEHADSALVRCEYLGVDVTAAAHGRGVPQAFCGCLDRGAPIAAVPAFAVGGTES